VSFVRLPPVVAHPATNMTTAVTIAATTARSILRAHARHHPKRRSTIWIAPEKIAGKTPQCMLLEDRLNLSLHPAAPQSSNEA
jgi:hypothetical protein